jgi:hypothetical protein
VRGWIACSEGGYEDAAEEGKKEVGFHFGGGLNVRCGVCVCVSLIVRI